MNRSFVASLTPARARLLRLMAKHTKLNIDDAVLACCTEGCITPDQFHDLGIDDPEEQSGVQFILDTNFRAGIPAPSRQRDRANRVVKAAIRVAGLGEDDTLFIDSKHSTFIKDKLMMVDFDFDQLLPQRHKVLFLNLDNLGVDEQSAQLIGRLFPRLVVTGAMTIQYSFSFGANDSTTCKMGALLYPQVQEASKKTLWKKNQRRSVLAMGVFPDLLKDADDVPKLMASPFIIPRTVEY